jgi:hypothetical protein
MIQSSSGKTVAITGRFIMLLANDGSSQHSNPNDNVAMYITATDHWQIKKHKKQKAAQNVLRLRSICLCGYRKKQSYRRLRNINRG